MPSSQDTPGRESILDLIVRRFSLRSITPKPPFITEPSTSVRKLYSEFATQLGNRSRKQNEIMLGCHENKLDVYRPFFLSWKQLWKFVDSLVLVPESSDVRERT